MDTASNREQILLQLKTRGPRSVKMLAHHLGMTTMGVRQHLLELQQQNLVTASTEPSQTRGRPRQVWQLTMAGHSGFPDRHASLAVDLLAVLERSLTSETFSTLLDDLGDREFIRYSQALQNAGNLEPRLAVLTRLRNEDGFMAELRMLPDNNWLLIENHCPVYAAASRCRQLCDKETHFLERILQPWAKVERTEVRLDNSRRCVFRISRLSDVPQ